MLELLHALLHGERTGRGAAPVIAIEPAHDRIAAKANDTAPVPVDLMDQSAVDAVELAGHFLRAALGAQFLGELFGERRKTGDVYEENRSAGAVR